MKSGKFEKSLKQKNRQAPLQKRAPEKTGKLEKNTDCNFFHVTVLPSNNTKSDRDQQTNG